MTLDEALIQEETIYNDLLKRTDLARKLAAQEYGVSDIERLREASMVLYQTVVLDDDPPMWECDAAWAKFAEAIGRDFIADMKAEVTP